MSDPLTADERAAMKYARAKAQAQEETAAAVEATGHSARAFQIRRIEPLFVAGEVLPLIAACERLAQEQARLREAEQALDEVVAPDPDKPLAQRIRDEFADFQMVLHHCSVIYDYVSGGRISKPNTLPDVVKAEADDRERERTDEAIAEATEELRAQVATLRVALERFGRHENSCALSVGIGFYVPPADAKCDCGLAAALAEEK